MIRMIWTTWTMWMTRWLVMTSLRTASTLASFSALALAFTLILSQSVHTQGLDPHKRLTQYTLRSWSTDEGCPSTAVLDILQTRDRYIWLATFNGLARFDGVRFTAFNQATVKDIHSPGFVALCEDSTGALWAGGNTNGGLYRYAHGAFTALTTHDGLSNNTVNALLYSPDSTLWIGTSGGLDYIIKPSANENKKSPDIGHLSELRGIAVWALHYEKAKTGESAALWIGTRFHGVYCFRGGRVSHFAPSAASTRAAVSFATGNKDTLWIAGLDDGLNYITQGELRRYTPPSGGPSLNGVRKVFADRSGALWIGTVNDKLLRLYNGRLEALNGVERLTNIESIHQDTEGNLWLGTYYTALSCLSDGKFTNFTTTEGLPNNIVHQITEDTDGSYWFGTNHGLCHLSNERITTFTVEQGHIPNNTVRDVRRDQRGALWIATFGGLVRYDKGRFTTFTTKQGLTSNEVRFIKEDHAGRLWIGTRNGLNCYTNGKFIPFTRQTHNLTSDYFLDIAEDREHRIWLGTDGGGLYCLSGGVFRNYTTTSGLASNVVFHIYEDRAGVLWIATTGGVCRLQNDSTFFTFNRSNGLPSNIIFQILEDHDGFFWLTSPDGVVRVSRNELSSFADGKQATLSCELFTKSHGMSATECTGASKGCVSRSGVLWLPTLGGAASVNPRTLWRNKYAPAVYIERCVADKTVFAPSLLTASQAASQAASTPAFTAAAGTRTLEFQYTGLSFITPSNVRFRYRLDGFDKGWVEAGTRRVAYYTNLPPGRYTFRVMACNSDGIWTNTDTFVSFMIEPFFYQTAWFVVCAVLGVLAGAYCLYRLRLRQLRRQKRALERTVAERTQEIRDQNTEILHQQRMLEEQARDIEISNSELSEKNAQLAQANTRLQELHVRKNEVISVVAHDLKSPVSSIVLSASSLERYGERLSPERLISSARQIRSTAERMNKIIIDLLDIDALDSGRLRLALDFVNIVAIVRQAVDDFSAQAADKNITLHFDTGGAVVFVIADTRALRQVFDNLLSNALKYSPVDKRVWIHLTTDTQNPPTTPHTQQSRRPEQIVRVSIQDEGPGISEEERPLLFQRFAKLTPKPTAGEHSTGLGLYIVKQFVEEMEGVIYCRSALGEGSTFVVEFPTIDDAEVAEHALSDEVMMS